jgi:hypothetical protein
VLVEGSPPGIVAAGGELFRGGHDVREEHRRQNTILRRYGLGLAQEPIDLGQDWGGFDRRAQPVCARSSASFSDGFR